MIVGDRVKVLKTEFTEQRGLYDRYGHVTNLSFQMDGGVTYDVAVVAFFDFSATIPVSALKVV